ncbi:MAG: amidase [Alphaproteobacteria bacterium]|nr:amidase [Alphaproteobacteria bacterium]
MTDFAYLTITEASQLLYNRKISPVEYTQALLDRIAAHDGPLHSFLHVSGDHALDAAKTAEAEIMAGDWRGPLHGVPYALKDIIDAAGEPTTCHSKVMARNSVPDTDAHVTAQFRAAGAVLVGKTATHEFAIGGPSFDLPWPPARNPWNPAHFTGGSSSGSGAALAAGFVPAALGTDTGGSVRNPASLCGLVGMKATYGRVSRRGVFPLSFTLDHVGPMTRTVEDNAILLNVIAGHDAQDPGSAPTEKPDFTGRIGRDIKGMRIGVIRHFFETDMQADPEMAKSINHAVDVLRGLGAEVSDMTVAPLDTYAATNRVILLSEAFAIHEKWFQERPEDYGELSRRRIMGGAFIRAADYVNATRVKARLVHEFDEAMRGFDVAITASSMDPACEIEDEEASERTYGRQARAPFNLTGSPALAVPTGFSESGLPLSMQIVGKPFDEAAIYQVAHAYEQATNWTERRPPLAA